MGKHLHCAKVTAVCAKRHHRSELGKGNSQISFKYAGSVYKDIDKLQTIIEANGDTTKAFATYGKHWGELKGFALALQCGKII